MIILNKYLMDTFYALHESHDLDKACDLIHKKNVMSLFMNVETMLYVVSRLKEINLHCF
jgi:hypothetical protein